MQIDTNSKRGLVLKSVLSLLAGAVVPALIIAVIFSVSLARSPGGNAGADAKVVELLSGAVIVFLFALAFTAAHAFILGVPLALVLIRFRLVRWWTCLPGGFLIGAIPSAWAVWPDLTSALVMGGGLGAIGGLTCWLAWHFLTRRALSVRGSIPGGQIPEPPAAA